MSNIVPFKKPEEPAAEEYAEVEQVEVPSENEYVASAEFTAGILESVHVIAVCGCEADFVVKRYPDLLKNEEVTSCTPVDSCVFDWGKAYAAAYACVEEWIKLDFGI